MSQISLSEVVMTLDGNGFTKSEAMELSSKIVLLADTDTLWLRGVTIKVCENEDFCDFEPQNDWQQRTSDILINLSSKERQCYLLSTVQSYSVSTISEILNLSSSSVRRYLENAKEKLWIERPYIVTQEMMNSLSVRCRQVYFLRTFREMTFKEISQELGVTPKTCRVHFQMAVRRFKHIINGGKGALSDGELRIDLQRVHKSRIH